MIVLTPAMADLVAVWGELADLLGRAPTRRELAVELDVNVSTVQSMTVALVERGWLAADRATLLRRLPAPADYAVELTPAGVEMVGLLRSVRATVLQALEGSGA